MDLSPTETGGMEALSDPPFEVKSYSQLLRVVSFLNVMNKKEQLLFRGQSSEWPLVPSLFRETWRPFADSGVGAVPLTKHRHHYMVGLESLRRRVAELLGNEKRLPRWRPFRDRPVPAWAVIQHYEIWPTPLLDLTASLRVAASFALGLRDQGDDSPRDSTGYVYVLAVPIQSDPMELKDDAVQALRLNSVCPPSAERPHFQEGFLMKWPEGEPSPRGDSQLVARFLLQERGSTFWSKDFPQHTRASLLPSPEDDELLSEFRGLFSYRSDGEKVSISVDGSPA
jgi:hypothetical protein